MTARVRVGIIGTGRMAYWHLRGYQKIKGVEVAAIAGRTQSTTERMRRKFRIPHGYIDYKEMLEKERERTGAPIAEIIRRCIQRTLEDGQVPENRPKGVE